MSAQELNNDLLLINPFNEQGLEKEIETPFESMRVAYKAFQNSTNEVSQPQFEKVQ